MAENPLNTKCISKALSILLTFTDESPSQRVSDVAEKLHLNISTVSRHLSTMLDIGFVERDNETGYYHLGVEIITLAGIALHSFDVYRHAYPELQRLSAETGLHCYLGIPHQDEIIHLISIGSEDSIELFTPIGHHHPMFCSAIGKAILGAKPPAEVHRILMERPLIKYAPDTKTDVADVENELARIRSQGYATICNELTLGKASIAAPIYDRSRNVVGAVSMSGSISTLDLPNRERELARIIIRIAGKISGKMGYFPR